MQIFIETFHAVQDTKTKQPSYHRQCEGDTAVWAAGMSHAGRHSVLIFRGGLLLHCDLINIDTVH